MFEYPIMRKGSPTFYFVGVTTKSSSIMNIFPSWMAELRRSDVKIEGVDCKIHDDPERFRAIIAQIKYDPNSLGALVTTHKIDLLAATQDMFDEIDAYAQLTHEVSSISKQGVRLLGHAKDPISAGLSLSSLLGTEYFGRTGGNILCFGAGGAGSAIALYLINQTSSADRPQRMIVTDKMQSRLANLQGMVESLNTDISFEYALVANTDDSDRWLAELPRGSVVVNATGMGKDVPGSPIGNTAKFPVDGIVWELNYRGELDFLHQAMAQRERRNLQIEDGWLYFLHGWTQVISEVLHIPLHGEVFNRLAAIAQSARGK